LAAGAEVQVLIAGYPTWLSITALWSQGENLLHATLDDHSGVLIGKDAIIGVRFGKVYDTE